MQAKISIQEAVSDVCLMEKLQQCGAWGEKIISIGFSVLCAVVGTTVFVWGWPPSSFMPMSRTSAAAGFQQTTQRMPLVLRSILYTFCVCG